jgi:hypothetical protein
LVCIGRKRLVATGELLCKGEGCGSFHDIFFGVKPSFKEILEAAILAVGSSAMIEEYGNWKMTLLGG